MMKKLLLTTTLLFSPLLFSPPTLAKPTPLSFDYIQVGAAQIEFADIPQFTARGFELIASKHVGYNVFAEATYFATKDNKFGEEFTADKWEVSLGYIQQLSSSTHLDYQLGYGDIDLGLSNGVESISTGTEYVMLETNIRHYLALNWEIYAGLEWQFWREGSDQKAYNLGSQYQWGRFIWGVEYTKYSDSEVFGIHGRYLF
jgi:hypothetical protein